MSFDSSSFGGGADGGDPELKAFLAVEGQKAKFQVGLTSNMPIICKR